MQIYEDVTPRESHSGSVAEHAVSWDARTRTKKIEVIVPFSSFDAIHAVLKEQAMDLTVSEVRSSGAGGRRQFYRGAEYAVLPPMWKIEMLVPAERVKLVIDLMIAETCEAQVAHRTKVLVYDIGTLVSINPGRRPPVD